MKSILLARTERHRLGLLNQDSSCKRQLLSTESELLEIGEARLTFHEQEDVMAISKDEHIVKRYDQELTRLRELVLEMGGLVENQIARVMDALG